MQGILLLNKPAGKTSFYLVARLRKILNEKKIGHAGTLDPFATGVMVMLSGKKYTTRSNSFLEQDKEYIGQIHLGISTDTYDSEGQIVATHDHIPNLQELADALKFFQGTIQQIPPMFSAKKVQGKKLYDLARQGISIERLPKTITLETTLLHYQYPYVDIKVTCSKGTYIRSIAHDLGNLLGCGGHLKKLTRTRSGNFLLQDCYPLEYFASSDFDIRHLAQNEQGIITLCKS